MLILLCPQQLILFESHLSRPRLVFSNKYENITPEVMTTSIWVTTALALILTLPSLGLFIVCYQLTSNIPISAIIGFGFHFFLFAISDRISTSLMSFVNDQKDAV